MTEQTQSVETQKEVNPITEDVVLEARMTANGDVTWVIPKNIAKAGTLLTMLNAIVHAKINYQLEMEYVQRQEAKKPNIITAIKGSPIMGKVLR